MTGLLPELKNIIIDYLPNRELLPWIDESKLDFSGLSDNTTAVDFLKYHPDKIDWKKLSKNPAAIDLLEENPEKIDINNLYNNEAGVHLLKEDPDKLCWPLLADNPGAMGLMKKYPDYIDWESLSYYPWAIELLEQYPENIYWINASSNDEIGPMLIRLTNEIFQASLPVNPNKIHPFDNEFWIIDSDKFKHTLSTVATNLLKAIEIDGVGIYDICMTSRNFADCPTLLQDIKNDPGFMSSENIRRQINEAEEKLSATQTKYEIIDGDSMIFKFKGRWDEWLELWPTGDISPHVLDILEKNLPAYSWCGVSTEINAIPLFEKNQDKINWEYFSRNVGIFTLVPKTEIRRLL